MIDAILTRLQRTMIEREVEAKRKGNADAARAWAEAAEMIQTEKRAAFGSPVVARRA